MRIFSVCTRPLSIFLLSAVFFFLQGCARPLLQVSPVSDQEARLTASAFTRYQQIYQSGCGGSIDAEVDATLFISGWLGNRKVKLSGYLQALEPGYIKFSAINPFGQPILIFLTDGRKFKLFNILEALAYRGSVDSRTFEKFAPHGFEPETSYFWLTGRLPPGDIDILNVLRDKEDKGYWLQVKEDHADIDSMVLFDPAEFVVRRRILVNGRKDQVMDIVYEDYQPEYANKNADDAKGGNLTEGFDAAETACMIPSRIIVSSNSGVKKKIELTLYSFIAAPMLSADDFELEIPGNLELRVVD